MHFRLPLKELLTDRGGGAQASQVHPGHPAVHMLSQHFLFLSAPLLPAIVRQPCQCTFTDNAVFFFMANLKIESKNATNEAHDNRKKNCDLCSVVHQHQNSFPARALISREYRNTTLSAYC